ncbi:MAG: Mu-like prophage major head subunit gpT family protein, partial [Pseudomonadota bacterium]
EQITLKQYAKRFRLSRKTIINDDLGAFTAVPRKMGRAAMRTVGDTVYAVLTANANMSDGKALFHADHSNLETGAGSAISTANIDKMSQKMAKQKDYSDKATLNIMPGFFLCPVALRSEAKILFASEKDPKATNANSARPNPIRNMISEDRIIADARLDVDSATAYYMLADPAAYDVIEVAYLNGVALPRLMQQSIWLTEGVTFEAAHDFGVKSLDWRTVQKANGAA